MQSHVHHGLRRLMFMSCGGVVRCLSQRAGRCSGSSARKTQRARGRAGKDVLNYTLMPVVCRRVTSENIKLSQRLLQVGRRRKIVFRGSTALSSALITRVLLLLRLLRTLVRLGFFDTARGLCLVEFCSKRKRKHQLDAHALPQTNVAIKPATILAPMSSRM